MTLDLNDVCPGGTGKKIKHCKCRDIAGDLSQILRSMQGGQRVAALDQINRLLVTHANRPCLLALKAAALLATQQIQELEETVATFLQVAPGNMIALGYSAMLSFVKRDVTAGVAAVQQALRQVDTEMPQELYEALGIASEVLIDMGYFAAGRAHLVLQAAISNDEQIIKKLVEFNGDAQVVPSLKSDLRYAAGPDDAPWNAANGEAVQAALRGAWQAAVERLEPVAEQFPDGAAILKNRAICLTNMAAPQAAAAWHRYAALPDLDWDEAVEAETLAQFLGRAWTDAAAAVMTLTYSIADANVVIERLLSAPETISRDVRSWERDEDDDSPPPKAIFGLLSKAPPATGEPWTPESTPNIIGSVAIFGKQTDRPARAEVVCIEGMDTELVRSQMRKLLDLQDQAPDSEEKDGSASQIVELFGRAYIHEDYPHTDRYRLNREYARHRILTIWPHLPCASLDGKTPAEVADDPTYRVRLAGSVLALQQVVERALGTIDLAPLNEQLGLPVWAPIHPTGLDVSAVAPVWRWRVDVTRMTDEQLVQWFNEAQIYSQDWVLREAGHEMQQRETLRERLPWDTVYGILAAAVSNPPEQLDYLRRAAAATEAKGQSPAPWLLKQIPALLFMQDVVGFQTVLRQLQTRHWQEPGVAENVFNLLRRLGILDANGEPAGGIPDEEREAAPPAAAGKLWTPGQNSNPMTESGEAPSGESKLWVPGMD